jgi:hypothetical protein
MQFCIAESISILIKADRIGKFYLLWLNRLVPEGIQKLELGSRFAAKARPESASTDGVKLQQGLVQVRYRKRLFQNEFDV